VEAPLNSGAPASSRPYGGETNLALMRNLLSRATSASPPQYYSHPGDMLWLLYRDPGYDPRTEVRLWEDRGGS
jgi:hypothetical protein